MSGNGDIPRRLSRGQRLTADWLNRLVDAVLSRTVSAGPGLRVTRTRAGTTISMSADRGSEESAESTLCALGRVKNDVEIVASMAITVEIDGADVTAYYVASSGYTKLKAGDVVVVHPCQVGVTYVEDISE